MFHNLKVSQTFETLVSISRAVRTVRSKREPRRVERSTSQQNHEQFTSSESLPEEQTYTAMHNDNLLPETKLSTATNFLVQKPANNLVVPGMKASEMINLESDSKTLITESTQHEKLADSITPLWRLRYKVQLQMKQDKAVEVLQALKKKLQANGIEKFPAQQVTTLCPLQDIIPSPVIHGYRNKDEFVVRPGVDGDPKTVGFITGHPADPYTVCVPPTHLLNIKPRHKAVCCHFENFIRQNKHPACLHFSDKPGVWRVITVRSTRAGHLMAIVVVHPHTLTQEELAELKGDLTSYFSTGAGAAAGLTSLYIQVW
ncbi:S-adenosyl-L-methionine-dependent methyltransferase [Trinorchestia longiramus]|nr:S-adenosyl-L-methionine-dependent methyltransferase [Trinorchestia longiramus]